MISIKRGKQEKLNIPQHIWCEILSNLRSWNDFMNIILTSKGLLEYINRMNPNATKNIEFSSSFFPRQVRNYVHKLFVRNIDRRKRGGFGDFGVDTFKKLLSRYGSGDFPSLLKNIMKTFPLISSLSFNFTDRVGGWKLDIDNGTHSFWGSVDSIQFGDELKTLKSLSVEVEKMNVIIPSLPSSQLFPNLETLYLKCDCGDYPNEDKKYEEQLRDSPPWVVVERPNPTLSVDWKNFPKLKKLSIRKFKLLDGSSFLCEPLLSNLESLSVSRVKNGPNLHEFKNLVSLKYKYDGSLGGVGIFEMPKLRDLKIVEFFCDDYQDNISCDGSPPVSNLHFLKLKDLPCLERLKITVDYLGGGFDYVNNDEGIRVWNFPNLRYIRVHGCPRRVLIHECPKLAEIDACGSKCIDYTNGTALQKGMDGYELKKVSVHSCSISPEFIRSIPWMKNLEEFSIQNENDWRRETDFLGVRSDEDYEDDVIELKGLPNLKKFLCCDKKCFFRVKLVEDCPMLQELEVKEAEGFIIDEDVRV